MEADPLEAYGHVEVVEMDHEEIPRDKDAVVQKAGARVKDSVPRGKGSIIDRVQEFVAARLGEAGREFPLPPYGNVLRDDRYWGMLEDCVAVVERYRTSGYEANLAYVHQDLMHLHGNLVYLSGVVGYLNASVEHAETAAKLRRSRSYLFAKQARDKLNVMVTDTDATEMAKAEAGDFDLSREHLRLAASTITNSYYAIRNFTDELGRIAQRTVGQERRSMPHST